MNPNCQTASRNKAIVCFLCCRRPQAPASHHLVGGKWQNNHLVSCVIIIRNQNFYLRVKTSKWTLWQSTEECLFLILLNSFSHVSLLNYLWWFYVKFLLQEKSRYRVLILTVKFFSDLPRLSCEKSLLCVTMQPLECMTERPNHRCVPPCSAACCRAAVCNLGMLSY